MKRTDSEGKREEIRTAVNKAARALEAYWDAQLAVELLTADDSEEADIPDLHQTWIEPLAVIGGEMDDEQLDLFLDKVRE